jgi:predicted dehydrogenase
VTHNNARRDFLKASALAAAGLCSGRRVWGSSNQPVNEKMGLAVIGVAGQGFWNLQQLVATDQAIVALCDVDEQRTAEARKLCPNARFFVDFRKMLDVMHKDIDAVLVATPDHAHAFATMPALQMGKHVYCEKPLTHSVWEAQQVMAAAKKYKLVTQMGTQIHAGRNYRRVVELVQTGAIGAIREVQVWCPTVWSGGVRPKESPVPAGLHWDLWLGPAPHRPYADKVYVPTTWRGWWDFGGGGHSDMACHYMDLAYWALELGHPKSVEAKGPPVDVESAPHKLTVHYEYPARGSKPPVSLTWYAGTDRPEDCDHFNLKEWNEGVLFVGEKGMLVSNYSRHKLLPEANFADFKPPTPFIPDSIGHHKEFIKACKEGGTTTCNFEYSGVLAQAVLLGNVAYRSGSKIEWNPANMKIPNARQAEKYLRRSYREGWKL